jgi:long-chain acyl-CoA synthetase
MMFSFWTMRAIYAGYLRLRVQLPANVPAGRPYIIAANHNSHLDTASIITALSSAIGMSEARRIHVLGARDYFFESALQGWLVSRLLNVVPIERKESSLSSLRLIKSILSNGEPVLIYPEGTRSRDGQLQSFKAGLGLMAWELKVPILPVLLEGTRQAMPVGRFFPKPGRIRVTFGKPVEMDDYAALLGEEGSTKESLYRQIAADVRARIVELKKPGLPIVNRD